MGDLGEECSAELLEMLLPVNILLIPVGGTYTIDAEQAKEYVDRLMPDIVIPMHYRSRPFSLFASVRSGKLKINLSITMRSEYIS